MKIRKVFFALCLVALTLFLSFSSVAVADAEMPFYDLDPKPSVLRAEFTTDYAKSSAERKHNIALAAKALNGAFIDVKAEFSFNDTVGERSAARVDLVLQGFNFAKFAKNLRFNRPFGV